MDTENNGELDTLEPAVEQETLIPEAEETIVDDELAKAQELANNYKIRAEKAEALAKQLQKKPEEKSTPKKDDDDTIEKLLVVKALADVHDEDVPELIKWAKYNNVSVSEAKKSPIMQSYLTSREEERRTAAAATTGNSRRTTSKNTGEAILERAMAGFMPESDEDIRKLAEARIAAKLEGKIK